LLLQYAPRSAAFAAPSPLSAVDLGAAVVRSLLERCQLPAAAVDELIFGQVLTAGCGQNPARQTALRAGLPVDTRRSPSIWCAAPG
jgi:acetyl-CoA C-acetyltransferase